MWFNEFNAGYNLLDKNVQTDEPSGEWMGFLSKQKANPLLLIGLNTVILDTVSAYPLGDGVLDVLRVICKQLLTFYTIKCSEIQTFTLELLPSILFVYLCFFRKLKITSYFLSIW